MTGVVALDLPAGDRPTPPVRARGGRAVRGALTRRYVAGPENRLAVEAARRLLAAAADRAALAEVARWSPVTLVGPTASGKTLVARGVADAWRREHGEAAVLVTPIGDFRRRFDDAVAAGDTEAFRGPVRGVRLLVLEDLQRAPKAPRLQDEIAATIDAISARGGVVLATSIRPLSESPGFSRSVLGRFAAGLTIDLAPAAGAARVELLRLELLDAGCRVDDDAVVALAEGVRGDGRRLVNLAAVVRERFGTRRVTATAVEQLLADEGRPATPPLRTIAAATARYYGMPARELRTTSRKKPVVLARAVAIYLARELTPLSYEDLGRFFGGRDHTTILHNHHRVRVGLAGDRALRAAVDELRRTLLEGV